MFAQFTQGSILDNLYLAFHYIYVSAPVWLPVFFGIALFNTWVSYKRTAYWFGMGQVLLEIKLPKEIFKSPIAMELVLGALHQTADESGWYWKYWRGQTRSWFSLEIASLEGRIHFYVWARKKYKSSIEYHFYSQYPGVEVQEVPDYMDKIYYDDNIHNMWACEWKLTQPDPYPIKTYVDYGLDKDPKEEFKIDPLSSVLEFMSSVTQGQNVLFQFIIRAHVKEQKKPGTWFDKTDAWKDEAKKIAEGIVDKAKEDKRFLTKGEQDTVSALERSTSKYPFDVGIRTIFIADKDKYSSTFIGGIIGSFKQFGSPGSNGFVPEGWLSYFNRPWKNWFHDEPALRPLVIEEYKRRRYFFSPHKDKYFYSKPFILNVEELATLFHLPGQVAAAPSLERVPSKKSEAPPNLPI